MSKVKVDEIESSSGGGIAAKITSVNGGQLSHRRLTINGSMRVAQRGTSSTSTGYQTVDRFKTGHTGLGVNVTQSQQSLSSSDSGPWEKGFRKYHRLALASAGTDSANNFLQIETCIEAQDIANSGWEYTSSSSYMTLSFWARASTAQNYGFAFHTQDGTAQLFPHTFALAANTWTKVAYSVPGNTNLAFDDNNGPGLYLKIFPYLGSTYNGGTNNTWAAVTANGYGASIPTTWLTAGASTFDVTGVQLEVGEVATSYEFKSYQEELAACQRYYFRQTLANNDFFGIGFAANDSFGDVAVQFPVSMRVKPTGLEQTGTAGDYKLARRTSSTTCSAVPTFANSTENFGNLTWTTGSGMNGGEAVFLQSTGDDHFLGWTGAEL